MNVLDVSFKCMQTAVKKSLKFTLVISLLLLVLKIQLLVIHFVMRKILLFLSQWYSLNQLSQLSVEPKSKADQDKMGQALQKLQEEDPTFRAHTDEETGQTIIAGMGELHLDILVDRMRREFKVEANVGAPQVAYRETFRGSATS